MTDHKLEPRHILDVKEQGIDKLLATMGEDVGQTIAAAVDCLGRRDDPGCRALIEADAAINTQYQEIEKLCLFTIASQQPVAHDLRHVVAAMRIANELERIADHAAHIAKSALELTTTDLNHVGLAEIQALAKQAGQMLNEAMWAYQGPDAALAKRIGAGDDELDTGHQALTKDLLARMSADASLVQDGSRMLWIAHNLERCGDRATNIAEQVVFRLEGQNIDLN